MQNEAFLTVLAGVTGLLGAKLAVTHMLAVRTRLMTSEYKTAEDSTSMPGPLLAVMRLLLGAFGPKFDQTRLQGITSNILENEPFLLLMGLMLGLTGFAQDHDILMLKAYAVVRFAHFFFYLFAIQPFRAMSFISGLSISLCFGVRLALLLL